MNFSMTASISLLISGCDSIEEGERTFLVSRLLDNKWIFAYGDKIFEIDEDDSLNQVSKMIINIEIFYIFDNYLFKSY